MFQEGLHTAAGGKRVSEYRGAFTSKVRGKTAIVA
jgi:hypothetical protein